MIVETDTCVYRVCNDGHDMMTNGINGSMGPIGTRMMNEVMILGGMHKEYLVLYLFLPRSRNPCEIPVPSDRSTSTEYIAQYSGPVCALQRSQARSCCSWNGFPAD